MASRIFAGCVVAFWVAMMVALVRVEFFPQPMPMDTVPAEQVMRRIFEAPEQKLNVYYQNVDIGNCTVETAPQTLPVISTNNESSVERTRKIYSVKSSVHLKLSVFGIPSHLRMVGNTRFNARYEVENFNIHTTLGEGRVDLQGDDQTQKVKMLIDLGEVHEKREFSFDQMKGAGLASALGLPGLSNLGFLGGGTHGRGSGQNADLKPRTSTALTELRIGEIPQRAYLVESRLGEGMWAKMWVDMSGAILRVDTSLGLMMVNNQIAVPQTAADKGRKRDALPKLKIPSHDSDRELN